MHTEKEIYRARRESFQKKMLPGSVAILFGGRPALKSNDVHYPFRQDSDFYYLTGFDEEESAIILTNESSVLYLRPRDPEKETWNGIRLGVERAAQVLGVDKAYDAEKFPSALPSLLKNTRYLYYCYGTSQERDALVLGAAQNLLRRVRMGEFGPTSIIHPSTILHEMRIIKSAEEIQRLEECGAITSRAHCELMRIARPGVLEYELHAAIQFEFRRSGATEAYPSIVASGRNACILHYTENNSRIAAGDLVLVDAGCEKGYMNADVTRTFPVSGRFSPPQRDLYQLVLAAQKAAISMTVVGRSMEEVHDGTVQLLVRGLIDVGLLKGSVEENTAQKEKEPPYKKFYMHKTGHWLGMDVHDVGSYFLDGKPRPFAEGMVCTVEPGLYVPSEDQSIPREFRGIGIRIEDDVLVTRTAARVLTGGSPKEIADIEELIAAARAA